MGFPALLKFQYKDTQNQQKDTYLSQRQVVDTAIKQRLSRMEEMPKTMVSYAQKSTEYDRQQADLKELLREKITGLFTLVNYLVNRFKACQLAEEVKDHEYDFLQLKGECQQCQQEIQNALEFVQKQPNKTQEFKAYEARLTALLEQLKAVLEFVQKQPNKTQAYETRLMALLEQLKAANNPANTGVFAG